MRYTVIHETSYDYSSAVAVSHQLLHLRPRTLPRQSCESFTLATEPTPAEQREASDYFGNPTTRLLISTPHTELVVRAESRVTVQAPAPLPSASTEPWEALRQRLRAFDPALLAVSEFCYDSPHVQASAMLGRYASSSFPARRGVTEAALQLMRRIHTDFEFDHRATTLATPLHEVMMLRRGVCQDFAHLMIGCLRSVGLAARYVSGYILTEPPPGKPKLIGADASHAWVSVYAPELGWVDLDPTNNCVVADSHVTLGWGRDFSDVTPLRGVILGGGSQTLEVHVSVLTDTEAGGDSRASRERPAA
jgi:transglutaminase-like putative cysteine protease